MTRIAMTGLALASLLMGTATASAQSGFPVLDKLTVRLLAAGPDAGDHTRLAAHFNALAGIYAAEAVRKTYVARTMTGNPNRYMGMPASVIWARRAERDAAAAETLRELAIHHDLLAFGLPSVTPADSARFENGEGAPAPTALQVAVAAARARTMLEHGVLVEYFLAEATRLDAIADRHGAAAAGLRSNPSSRIAGSAVHCERLAKESRDAATAARRSANEHTSRSRIG